MEAQFLEQCQAAYTRKDQRASRAMLTGTCALIVHVDKLARAINVVNIGDSRAVLAERDEYGILEAAPLSFDHSARSDYERHRLKSQFPAAASIVVEQFDTFDHSCDYSVHGLSQFTRSIGDFELKWCFAAQFFNSLVKQKERQLPMPDEAKPWISHEPHIMFRQLHHRHEFLIQACDGLWDEMSSDAAVYLVGHYFGANPGATGKEAASFLLDRALKLIVERLATEEPEREIDTVAKLSALPGGKQGRRALHDDISVAVIRFIAGDAEQVASGTWLEPTDSKILNGPNVKRGRAFSTGAALENELGDMMSTIRASFDDGTHPVGEEMAAIGE
jgi:serine/threonine protein phosphatase PrpC